MDCYSSKNPIQLCALYKRKKNSPKAYGKHTGKTIGELGEFDFTRYTYCPYSSHNKHNSNNKLYKEEVDSDTKYTLKLLRENFDRVIYLLQRSSGLIISANLAEKMLISFMGRQDKSFENNGYLYKYFNKSNFPFIFAYRSAEFSIRGQYIKLNSDLHKALLERNIVLSKEGQVEYTFTDNAEKYSFAFIHHKVETIQSVQTETMLFCIFDSERNKVFEKKIIFDLEYISNVLHINNEKLLDIAKKIITDSYF